MLARKDPCQGQSTRTLGTAGCLAPRLEEQIVVCSVCLATFRLCTHISWSSTDRSPLRRSIPAVKKADPRVGTALICELPPLPPEMPKPSRTTRQRPWAPSWLTIQRLRDDHFNGNRTQATRITALSSLTTTHEGCRRASYRDGGRMSRDGDDKAHESPYATFSRR